MGMVIMNGVEYASAPKDGFPPMIYSLEEREIGVWTDGKPLYQKTYEVTSVVFGGVSNNNNFVLTPEIEIKHYEGYILRSNNRLDGFIKGFHDSLNGVAENQNISQMTVRKQSASPNNAVIQFSVASALQSDFQKVIITIQYTKSTDVPGSGKYTTYGGLAHHYSTTEQVIGTWINGKPIYEKVIPVTTTAGSYNLDVSALHIDYVVFIKVRIQNANNLSHSYCDSPYWYSNTDWFRYYFPENNSFIRFESGSGFSYGSGYVILQYTKTTD